MNRLSFLKLTSAILPAAALGACGTTGTSAGAARRDPNLITAEELADLQTVTALDAIRRLRPRWLQPRGGSRPQAIVNGSRTNDLEDALRAVQASAVASMRFLSAADATMRFGVGFAGGVIEVTTRAR